MMLLKNACVLLLLLVSSCNFMTEKCFYGYVENKEFVPAHLEKRTEWYYDVVNEEFDYEEVTVSVPDRWFIYLASIDEPRKEKTLSVNQVAFENDFILGHEIKIGNCQAESVNLNETKK